MAAAGPPFRAEAGLRRGGATGAVLLGAPAPPPLPEGLGLEAPQPDVPSLGVLCWAACTCAWGVCDLGAEKRSSFFWAACPALTLTLALALQVCGLCGNYNGWAGDELLMPGGQQAQNVTQFGNSWKVEADSEAR